MHSTEAILGNHSPRQSASTERAILDWKMVTEEYELFFNKNTWRYHTHEKPVRGNELEVWLSFNDPGVFKSFMPLSEEQLADWKRLDYYFSKVLDLDGLCFRRYTLRGLFFTLKVAVKDPSSLPEESKKRKITRNLKYYLNNMNE